MAQLTLVLDSREVRTFVLNKGITTIGRAQENDIVINNLALSRKHAQVESQGSTYRVVDLGSQNGVYVNGERVQGKQVLRDQDAVTLGTYQFVFRDEPAQKGSKRPVSAPAARGKATKTAGPSTKKEPVPLLVLKYNDVELQRFPLVVENCVIGRAKECDVQVAERRLSRRHCQIFKGDGGRYFLKDLGSQNGTYVNRRRIRGFYELQHTDIVNFAEYAVHYLADMDAYAGPDADDDKRASPLETMAPAPVMSAGVESEETAVPEAYRDDPRAGFRTSGVSMVRPSDLDEDPDDPLREEKMPMSRSPKMSAKGIRGGRPQVEPLTRAPAEAKATRGPKPLSGGVRVQPVPKATLKAAGKNGTGATRGRVEAKGRKRRGQSSPGELPAEALEHVDVPDRGLEAKPDVELESWYSGRDHHSQLHAPMPEAGDTPEADDAEPAELLARGRSSVSQVLSTMMVDKRELDRSLKRPTKKRERRFVVDVRHNDKRIYSGPLDNPVTILGRDPEADIQLKGRYVAGRHSLLVRVHDSLLLVRLGSSSAARVNGLPKLQAFLKDGDLVQIDETTIQISEE